MEKTKAREFSAEFKVAAVKRMRAGEATARVADELGVRRKLLYDWKRRWEQGGEENLRPRAGRPRKSEQQRREQKAASERQRIAALERLVGRQQALIAFFERALQAVEQLPEVQAGKAPSTNASGTHGSKKR